MKRSSGSRNTASNLSKSIHQQLNMYALAASAAGVSALALAPAAQAKIIYTKAHDVIGFYGLHTYNLDLNHDGITDFALNFGGAVQTNIEWLGVRPEGPGNGIVGHSSASALIAGARIGPKDRFVRTSWASMVQMRGYYDSSFTSVHQGFWANVTDRYLGLKILVTENGATAFHYGWARLTVRAQRSGIIALLTGYAYETLPNKPIIAGQTHEADAAEQPAPASLAIPAGKPATLGLLARGAPGLSIWRKEGLAEAAQRTLGPR